MTELVKGCLSGRFEHRKTFSVATRLERVTRPAWYHVRLDNSARNFCAIELDHQVIMATSSGRSRVSTRHSELSHRCPTPTVRPATHRVAAKNRIWVKIDNCVLVLNVAT
jgi:hypothetical protein